MKNNERIDLLGRQASIQRHLKDIRQRHSIKDREEAERNLLEILKKIDAQLVEVGR